MSSLCKHYTKSKLYNRLVKSDLTYFINVWVIRLDMIISDQSGNFLINGVEVKVKLNNETFSAESLQTSSKVLCLDNFDIVGVKVDPQGEQSIE